MEMIIDILKLVVPTVIALVSLAYAIKQRSVVKREISKKRYLEEALSNLNQAIASLKAIQQDITVSDEDSGEKWCDSETIVMDIFRASFDLKKKKITLKVSYVVQDLGERDKPYSESNVREFKNLDIYESQWLVDLVGKTNKAITVESKTQIVDFRRASLNDLSFFKFVRAAQHLIEIEKALSSFEEVYESVSSDSMKKASQLSQEVVEEIFEVVAKPKNIEIDLESFSETHEIAKYLLEEILNYSHITETFSKVSEIVSELEKARKELFLKIS